MKLEGQSSTFRSMMSILNLEPFFPKNSDAFTTVSSFWGVRLPAGRVWMLFSRMAAEIHLEVKYKRKLFNAARGKRWLSSKIALFTCESRNTKNTNDDRLAEVTMSREHPERCQTLSVPNLSTINWGRGAAFRWQAEAEGVGDREITQPST